MSNKDYFESWLKLKEQFKAALAEDERIQELAVNFIGIKPQATAVEIVARVYSKYCELYNKLCDCYDQMEQVQRRPYIRKIIDAITCRIIELKKTLEEIEVFEYTYPDNAFQQMLIQPYDVEIMCPFFYPFEIRRAEMQYIMDQIFSGNRIGDPTPTPSEIERIEEERQQEEQRIQEQKDAEIRRKMAFGEDPHVFENTVVLTPAELEEKRLTDEYNKHIFNIQKMERSRLVLREKKHKAFKDENLYLELAGLKKPPKEESLRNKSAELIKKILKRFMEIKRVNLRETKLREKLGMVITSWQQPSAKVQLEKVKEARRNFRRTYYEQWIQQNIKEKARVLRLREGDIMDDITDEIRQWFTEWFREVRVFDEFPFAEEGGSILIVRGETFTIDEFIQWRTDEEKRLKAGGGQPPSKEQIKAEKQFQREEKRRLAAEAKDREKKRLNEYKKSRMHPDNDPGIYIMIGHNQAALKWSWQDYEMLWREIDVPDAGLDAIKGHIMRLITENAYKEIQIELRPIVDEIMRLELDILKNALKSDYQSFGMKVPQTKKRKKPKKPKPPKPEKVNPKVMFQLLADHGIVRKYPRTLLEDYWGDRNYAASDCRAVLWTPKFPPPCIGDLKEQIRIRCILTLGATCHGINRSQLFVGPKGAGKKTLIYAIATETNALLIDLSPLNVYNKFLGGKNTRTMFSFVNKISRLMQPTVILVDQADKLFYKRVPKEEKMFDPTRFSKDLYKEIIKPIGMNDKILVLGTATEPWLSKTSAMHKAFPSTIMIPRTDYGSISYILTKMLMKYHGVNRDFNVHSIAQALRGYDIHTIREVVESLMKGKRLAELYYKPLEPMEILQGVLKCDDAVYTDTTDTEMFNAWYMSYSPWGPKYVEYMLMLESQYLYKLKADKKNKKAAA
ncbi:IQ and AAA domain-containing protein 1-like [Trichoplusia ni]|uniref:IQ and AAA domain-containing protein 1-like n=1 Tax=Trichoplusia ni TaxID=7111 RepID=A0A7E5WMX5_TRINI|nr:IQ and AAA domain-containing protein 1-like [Trichoplusia ni]